jgi:hypothetical protein
MLKRIAYALTGLIASAAIAMSAGLPILPSNSQYSEPSQIVGTINALIQQLNGQAGYAAQNSTVSIGSYCTNTTGGASPQVCNGQRGEVLFTGISALAVSTTQTLVVTNANVAANSTCHANFKTAFTAGSAMTVATIVPTAGSLSILVVNAGATTNGVTTGTLAFYCTG